MSNNLDVAETQLLKPTGLTSAQVESLLGTLCDRTLDLGVLYFQHSRAESWALEDGIVKDGSFSVDRGVGVRAVSGEKTGFAYADDITLAAITSAATAARSIARQGGNHTVQAFKRNEAIQRYAPADPISSISDQTKVALLRDIDSVARAENPAVKEVNVRMSASHEVIMVMASDGTFSSDIRPLVRLDVSVIVEKDGRRERGSSGAGGRRDLSGFNIEWASGIAREAVRTALVNLDAIDAPAGPMTVVLGSGWPGVLLHEAVGHGLEGDNNRKGTSSFSGLIGQQIASPLCTVVDDGTLTGRRGSLNVDDEGTATSETVLIENGILTGYLQDKLNARLMNTRSTGNARRQSYACLPMPRMTNTFMRAGQHDPGEIISSVKKGVYAVNFGGGQVDTTSGKFVFSATEAYLIENGRVTAPIKGATLIGTGPEVMKKISMVGNDLALDDGIGVCGKDGQSVPVGVGQPTLKVDEITLGGTQTGH
ncbi:MAG: metalloprotease TldD [Proteobacteria bacterium]|nr:metalloprotease TldD [Pseudomonadota bacterium]